MALNTKINNMKKIAITGLSGTIGRVLGKEIGMDYYIIDLYNKKKCTGTKVYGHKKLDLLAGGKIGKILESIAPDIIIHMAAATHIDNCEKDKPKGKKGKVWQINVEGSRRIAEYCAQTKTHLIFLSTECVFDGKEKGYTEEHKKNPINWYGVTKSEAENAILSTDAPIAIIRSVVAYHKDDEAETIYGKLLNQLKSGEKISAVVNQKFTPTNTHDIVRAIKQVVKKGLTGTYHVVPEKPITPYDFALIVAKKNKYPSSMIKKTTLVDLYGSKRASLRLKNAILFGKKSAKILNFTPLAPNKSL